MTASPLDLDAITLDHGSHRTPGHGHCLMEAVSMFAKEPFTDAPTCVSPYLREFGINLNDRATAERRQDLKRFITLVVGTAGDGLDEQRRWLAADHVTRVTAPKWLDRAGLTEYAAKLRAVDPITDEDSYDASRQLVREARDAAYRARNERLEPVKEAVRKAVREKFRTDAVADVAADAVADVAADAAADVAAVADVVAAAVAVADAVAAADVVADAVADADVVADAVADVVADAVADADVVADAVADVAADGSSYSERYWAVRDAVYAKVRAIYEERYADVLAESWQDALDLYERLITCEVA